jgi:tetratricopeptide (TPR) repeat protein
MDPAYLHALMHGEISFKKKPANMDEDASPKNKLEKDLEKEIDTFVNGLEFDEDPSRPSFQSPKLKRQKIKLELNEASKMPDLFDPVNTAIEVIFSEGTKYLSQAEYDTLVVELAVSTEYLANIGTGEAEKDIQTAAQISNVSIKALEKIAVAKFEEERYPESLGLLCLLSVLVSGNAEYWFRLGIAAQRCENLELASKAYGVASDLNRDNIGARLFAAQCFIDRSLLDEAKKQISEAKDLVKKGPVDQVWLDFLRALENTLTP